jgi:hypothetical protein
MTITTVPTASKFAVSDPWYAAYPLPKNKSPAEVDRAVVVQWLREGGMVLVDLRTDHEVSLTLDSSLPSSRSFYLLFMIYIYFFRRLYLIYHVDFIST